MLLRLAFYLPLIFTAIDEPTDLLVYRILEALGSHIKFPDPAQGGYDDVADIHDGKSERLPVWPILACLWRLQETWIPIPGESFFSVSFLIVLPLPLRILISLRC